MSSSLYVAPSHTSSMAHKQVFMQPCSCCPIQVFPNSRLVEGVWGINCLESNPHFSRKTDPAEEGLRHPRRNLSETIGLSSDRSALRTACRRGRPRVDHVRHRWDSAVLACRIETTGYVSLSMHPRDALIGRSRSRGGDPPPIGRQESDALRPIPLRVQIPHVRALETG